MFLDHARPASASWRENSCSSGRDKDRSAGIAELCSIAEGVFQDQSAIDASRGGEKSIPPAPEQQARLPASSGAGSGPE